MIFSRPRIKKNSVFKQCHIENKYRWSMLQDNLTPIWGGLFCWKSWATSVASAAAYKDSTSSCQEMGPFVEQ